jgi:hypothetical protein
MDLTRYPTKSAGLFRKLQERAGTAARGRAADQPPGGSQANPPGVLTQFTGPPEFETAEEPSGPQGMPTAGLVSRPADGVDDVDVGRVVCATVVRAGELTGAVVVTGDACLVVGGSVVTGADVVTTGLGVTTGGAGGGGGGAMSADSAVVIAGTGAAGSAEVLSTLVGVSSDREAERNAFTPKNQASSTTAMTAASAAECCSRRLRASANSSASTSSSMGSSGFFAETDVPESPIPSFGTPFGDGIAACL